MLPIRYRPGRTLKFVRSLDISSKWVYNYFIVTLTLQKLYSRRPNLKVLGKLLDKYCKVVYNGGELWGQVVDLPYL